MANYNDFNGKSPEPWPMTPGFRRGLLPIVLRHAFGVKKPSLEGKHSRNVSPKALAQQPLRKSISGVVNSYVHAIRSSAERRTS